MNNDVELTLTPTPRRNRPLYSTRAQLAVVIVVVRSCDVVVLLSLSTHHTRCIGGKKM